MSCFKLKKQYLNDKNNLDFIYMKRRFQMDQVIDDTANDVHKVLQNQDLPTHMKLTVLENYLQLTNKIIHSCRFISMIYWEYFLNIRYFFFIVDRTNQLDWLLMHITDLLRWLILDFSSNISKIFSLFRLTNSGSK